MERIGWDQQPMPGAAAGSLQFAAYVDVTRGPLPDVRCTPRADGILDCTAQLPAMTLGLHALRLASIGSQNGRLVESTKSDTIFLVKVTSLQSNASSLAPEHHAAAGEITAAAVPAPAQQAPSSSGEREFVIERVAETSRSLADLAVSARGEVFAAERLGRVLVLRRGTTVPLEALELTDVATSAGRGLFSIALHPDFETNGLVYMVYATQTATEPVHRIARGRAHAGRIAEIAVLLDAAPAAPNGWAVLRFGPDRRLYVALGDDQERRSSDASYEGKLLRLDDDGRPATDNPATSPIVASVGGTPSGLLWTEQRARLILRRSRATSEILFSALSRNTTVFNWSSPARPAALAYVAGQSSAAGGFLYAGDLSGGLHQIPWPAPPDRAALSTDRVIAREYGAVRAVAAAHDGSMYFGTANIDVSATDATPAVKDFIVRISPRQRGPR